MLEYYTCVNPPRHSVAPAGTEELVVRRLAVWPADMRLLRVGFLETDDLMFERVLNLLNGPEGWGSGCAMQFAYEPELLKAHIRVGTEPGASWSYLRTEALGISRNQVTMNVGVHRATQHRDLRRLVEHEFGHALGWEHELSSYNAHILWDVEKVYAYYAQFGWTTRQVDAQVFRQNSSEFADAGFFDVDSIMCYGVPAALTQNNVGFGGKDELSNEDRVRARERYGEPNPTWKKIHMPTVMRDRVVEGG